MDIINLDFDSKSVLVNVRYTVNPNKREEFLAKAEELGIIRDSKNESGNLKYDFYLPVDSKNDLFLLEIWANSAAQQAHGKTNHYQKLQALKQEYVSDVSIEKYLISEKL